MGCIELAQSRVWWWALMFIIEPTGSVIRKLGNKVGVNYDP
jgi:hypothetical protein